MALYDTSLKQVPAITPDPAQPLTRAELHAISVALIVLRDRHIAAHYRAKDPSNETHNRQAGDYLNQLRYKVEMMRESK